MNEVQNTFSKQGSISSTFYEQLSRPQIPNAQKRLTILLSLLALLISAQVKAALRTLAKLTPEPFFQLFLMTTIG
jgi:hypothetical protein